MSRDICVCLDFLTDAHKAQIRATAEKGGMTVRFFTSDKMDEAAAYGKTAEVLYACSPKLLKQCDALKWYCCSFAGVDVYCKDPSLFPNAACQLTNSNVYGLTISEHVVMVTLMLLRRMPEYGVWVRGHQWKGGLSIRSIKDCHLTMLGTGQIGQCIAHSFRALGAAKITGVSRSGRPVEGFDEVYPVSQLDKLLPETELLVMAVPGTGETEHILSAERIALLKENAYVINVGRGTAVDQDALIQALNAGKIAGAALDVVDPEPLPPDHPLWEAKNLILTPHVSGNMTLAYTCDMNVDQFCEDLENYMAGRPLAHLVDLSKGY